MEELDQYIYRDPLKHRIIYRLHRAKDGRHFIQRKYGRRAWRNLTGYDSLYIAQEEFEIFAYEHGLYRERVE